MNPMQTVESGHVIAVVQSGYMLGDRVIRPTSRGIFVWHNEI